jgi:hypothetical protein
MFFEVTLVTLRLGWCAPTHDGSTGSALISAPWRTESTIKDVAAYAILYWASGLFHS